MANAWVIAQPVASFSLINTVVSVTSVGVPVSFPFLLSWRPAGSAPLTTEKAYGLVPLTPSNLNCTG